MSQGASSSDRLWRAAALPHRDEQAAFVAEGFHPGKLREPLFRRPRVSALREELVGVDRKQRRWIGPDVLDVVRREPSLHFAESVPVLGRMLILIAQPGLAPRGFMRTV